MKLAVAARYWHADLAARFGVEYSTHELTAEKIVELIGDDRFGRAEIVNRVGRWAPMAPPAVLHFHNDYD